MAEVATARPTLLNKLAWDQRWRDRTRSTDTARHAASMSGAYSSEDRHAAGLALRTLAWQSRWRGTLTSAERECDQALAMLKDLDAAAIVADVEASLAIVYHKRGQSDRAWGLVRCGFARVRRDRDPETYLDLVAVEADILRGLGNSEIAHVRLREALDLATGCETARVQHALGRFHLWVGDPGEALVAGLSAVASARRWGNAVILPRALALLGAVHRLSGRSERAEACLTEAAELALRDGDVCAECEVLHQLGALNIGRSRVDEGITLLETGRSLASRMGYVVRQQMFCKELAGAYEAAGDLRNALDAMKALNVLRERQSA